MLSEPFAGRTWREFGYVLIGFVFSIPTFVLALLGVVSLVLSLFTIGLPLLVGVLFVARGAVRYFRVPARRLLGWDWAAPPPRTARGPIRWGSAVVNDGGAWRALAYCVLRFPLMTVAAYLGAFLVFGGLVALTYPLWWWTAPGRFAQDTPSWAGTLAFAAEGVAALLVFPWLVRLLVAIDRRLITILLEPNANAARIAALEAGRAELRADAEAVLRRVERDLHDGTQARLVGLGVALSRIERRTDDPATRQLAAEARTGVAQALAELREIVRGMHPPALDDGLETALATLAARSAVPVDLTVDLAEQPSAPNASALYFIVAELLTNVARHSGATRVRIDLRTAGDHVRLQIGDDGRGGATTATGTGLAGLGRRARALDGTLTIHSPPGGPTDVVLTLPTKG
jgi:signal transduction histidine kinase